MTKGVELRRLKSPSRRTLQDGQKVEWGEKIKKRILHRTGFPCGERPVTSPWRALGTLSLGLSVHASTALPNWSSCELLGPGQLALLPGPSKHSSPGSFRKATLPFKATAA